MTAVVPMTLELEWPAIDPTVFHPAVEEWFRRRFPDGPTAPQEQGWPLIAAGRDTLIAAPTGSGKTLAGFLVAINSLYLAHQAGADVARGVRVVYVSPLKALAVDVAENLQKPLAGALFRPDPRVHAHVAEMDGQVVGIAVWFLSFSTWTGRHSLYLEDIFVDPGVRGGGVGRALMRRLAVEAAARGCARMEWSVLDWNQPAMAFYRSIGARPMAEWTTWRVDGEGLDRLAGRTAPLEP